MSTINYTCEMKLYFMVNQIYAIQLTDLCKSHFSSAIHLAHRAASVDRHISEIILHVSHIQFSVSQHVPRPSLTSLKSDTLTWHWLLNVMGGVRLQIHTNKRISCVRDLHT